MPSLFCCVECKPCDAARALFKCRRPTFQLRRAFGKVKVGGGGRRRRRRPGSFSSVRAVFWPLMSMRSDVDDRPPSASTDDSGARAPSPSLDDTPAAGAASVTAARVLALQARLGEEAASVTTAATGAAPRAPSPARDDTTTSACRVLALQTRLGDDDAASPLPSKAGSIRVQAVREHANAAVIDDRKSVEDVELACRSFEKHLMEMVVEERKVLDLTDVEELLCCWEKLRSPVFVQLVGRFYGDLCMDLFYGSDADVSSE
jgi:hypothetical protein